MSSVFSRLNRDGSTTYRVQIRRKGLPTLCLAFATREEAEDWSKIHEYNYIIDPKPYLDWINKERINLKRKREFNNK